MKKLCSSQGEPGVGHDADVPVVAPEAHGPRRLATRRGEVVGGRRVPFVSPAADADADVVADTDVVAADQAPALHDVQLGV
ncbi:MULTISPECIES: hypothetical protein [Streptomyces]|uniref:Uncharacterized protein n=1 Tax=Streptomyces anthocyanicus TaxID=68174 RepID=A0ABZ1M8A5_9ACTN|nr:MULTISPECIES: hypothetical protein [Streptomyces]MBQ0949056.1 hypothetical protein [Streptomyces sp. RK76]MDX3315359.1 hypothetical protein [Streptomyces sp. ME03-5684b]WSB58769.1 hypothetical protein OIE72_00430 [Streptomyces anthocyanicus]WSB65900.1 hypothetical protein OIE72_39015 [Streptomyces anthocyanicus]WTC13451.1 hypothetical protein OHA15_38830 [Streptomyces anthocyanicus]